MNPVAEKAETARTHRSQQEALITCFILINRLRILPMNALDRTLEKIRNIGIIAHIDAGKTTTTERMLYYADITHKMGGVDEGTTVTDFDEEEADRGITIYGAAVSFDWKDYHINLIDTPGHVDFTAEVERALRVLDGAVCVFSAREGVEAQSETVWKQANKYDVPRICFINKMDREGADFFATLQQMEEILHANPLPVEIPLGSGPSHVENPFRGVIDLIEMQVVTFDPESLGKKFSNQPIPAEAEEMAQQWRQKLLDELSNHNDELMMLAMEEEPIPPELIRKTLRDACLASQVRPVLCGSALHNIGVQPLMDAVGEYLPSPLERPPVEGFVPEKKSKKRGTQPTEAKREVRKPDPDEPFCGLVFKVLADKHGDLCFVRIYSGTVKANSRVLNSRLNEKENCSQIWHVQADSKQQIPEATVGDIVGVIGLRESVTGDTICDVKAPIALESITFPETVISMAIEPESSNDRKKLGEILELLKRQDPTFNARPNEETGQTLISGMGELHLEIIKNRLKRDFNLNVKVHKPRVSYRETIEQDVEVVGLCDRQVGDKRLYATVTLKLERLGDDDENLALANTLGENVPEHYQEVIMEELEGRLHGSGITGNPLSKLRLTAVSAEISEEETTETAVRLAVAHGFEEALQRAGTIVLEPLMRVEVSVPDEFLGNVSGDLLRRRAHLGATSQRGPNQVVTAEVPLEEMFGYSSDVRSLTQGRAGWSMEPARYAEAPAEVKERFF